MTLLFLVLLIVFLFILYGCLDARYRRIGLHHHPLPPGPAPDPFIANLRHLPLQYQHKAFASWSSQYGQSPMHCSVFYSEARCSKRFSQETSSTFLSFPSRSSSSTRRLLLAISSIREAYPTLIDHALSSLPSCESLECITLYDF